jgi:hypothetical protein
MLVFFELSKFNLTYVTVLRIIKFWQETIFMNFLAKLLFESEKIHVSFTDIKEIH